jgi:two-component system nitrate/nitrite response regulator NarL
MLQKIDVFLLTENRLLREALVRMFGKRCGIKVVGATSVSSRILDDIVASDANILLSDSSAHILTEPQIIPELRRTIPNLRVVLIGMEPDAELFLTAVRAGVVGYVLKDASSADVAAAVRAVAADEAVCPAGLCLSLFNYVADPQLKATCFQANHPFGLTRREQQLVELLGRGLTNKEIASELSVSEQTVKNHVHRVLRKVGAGDRLQAAELCRDTVQRFGLTTASLLLPRITQMRRT